MTSDVSKKKTVAASGQDVISGKKNPRPRSASDIINKKTVSHDRRVTGYTRVKSESSGAVRHQGLPICQIPTQEW